MATAVSWPSLSPSPTSARSLHVKHGHPLPGGGKGTPTGWSLLAEPGLSYSSIHPTAKKKTAGTHLLFDSRDVWQTKRQLSSNCKRLAESRSVQPGTLRWNAPSPHCVSNALPASVLANLHGIAHKDVAADSGDTSCLSTLCCRSKAGRERGCG